MPLVNTLSVLVKMVEALIFTVTPTISNTTVTVLLSPTVPALFLLLPLPPLLKCPS
jgi:hypothetical protein